MNVRILDLKNRVMLLNIIITDMDDGRIYMEHWLEFKRGEYLIIKFI